MGVETKAVYKGDERVAVTHGPTGSEVLTDLPLDNGGRGRGFSPTDLLAASLASCILTIMAKAVAGDGVDLKGASVTVDKKMTPPPRRVESFTGTITLPPGLSEKTRAKLSACVQACPVSRSLHPDVKLDLEVV
ncbi:MAG: OsmC family protein [Elusimicrobia bacterium]|nr:OsmC family protein [Elusimicrobiota bacterium]